MILYPVTAFLTTASALGIGSLVLAKNPKAAVNKRWGILNLTIALWSIFLALMFLSKSQVTGLTAGRLLQLGANFIPITFFHFILALLGLESKKKIWLKTGYGITALMVVLGFTPLFIQGVAYRPSLNCFYPVAGSAYLLYISVFFLYPGYAWLLMAKSLRHTSSLKKNQIKYVMIASTIGFLGGSSTFPLWYGIQIPPFGAHFVFLYTTIISLAIIRHRLMDINLALTRTSVFMVVYALVLGVPLLAALTWRPQLEQFLGTNWWVWLLVTYAALATAAHYANQYFQRRAEDRLLAEQHRYQGVLRKASQGMTLVKELDKLLNRTVRLITREVRLKHAAIYLWDERAKRFIPKASRQWKVAQPPTFSQQDPLVDYFIRWHRGPLVTEELQLQARGGRGQTDLPAVVTALKSLDAAVLIPSFVNERCMGFLILGEKRSGTIFTPDDLVVFQVLANQAGLAIENAIFYEELQRTQTDLFQTAKMANLGHMAGGMSHQANNRFYVLTMLAGVLKSKLKELGPDPFAVDPEKLRAVWSEFHDFSERVEKNALQGGDIVKTILKFSRPSGEYKPITPPQIISTAHEVAQFRVDLNQLNWKEAFPENLPYVNGDLNQLADCVLNLITNSYDAIQKKVELLKKNELPINPEDPSPYKGEMIFRGRLEKNEEKHWVVLEVKDNGTGMTPQELENLFIPFFTTKATSQKGTGLGIFVIRRIIEQHGGTVTASSSYGIGTTFTIRLPALTGLVEGTHHA